MDLKILENQPDVAPLILSLYDKSQIYNLAKQSDPMARSELTSVMVDLLRIDLTPHERELVADVMIGLMRQAERDLRKALSERLASYHDIPLRMVLHLANDEIDVADPILRDSPALTDMDLVYIIKAKGEEHWQSIAQRETLSGRVIDILVNTKNEPTAIKLSENTSVSLTDHAVRTFAEMAKESDALAKPLLERPELPSGLVRQLYDFVGEALKIQIREKFGEHAPSIEAESECITAEFVQSAVFDFVPSTQMLVAAEQAQRHGLLRVDTMIQTLRSGRLATFVAEFSVYCGLPVATIGEMLQQKTGQGLAIAAKALRIQKGDFVSMFLLTQKMRDKKQKIVDQNELSRALKYYDKIDLVLARRIMSQSRH